jgi:endonuclease/exonuclease/phosphatase family metal-dependent hydrolase
MRTRAWIGLAAVLVGLVVVVALVVVPRFRGDDPTSVTVMTRNLYLGADINRPVRAATGRTGSEALLALGQANHELRRIVDRTDFRIRSRLVAAEIAAARPDLVGLQEVALWRSGPMELDQLGHPNATTVDYDFLDTLLTDLARRSVVYDVVQSQDESDVEGPAFTGDPTAGTAESTRDVRLTLRDVLLVRADAGINIADRGSGQYQNRLEIELSGIRYAYIRGFAWADLEIGRSRVRLVTTHLESESAGLALAQAEELLAGPAGPRSGLTVIACDCNSDPLDHTTKPTDPVPTPHSAAYDLLVGAGGFHDEWLLFAPAAAGFTSGFSELVDDPDLSGIDHRIDMILGRSETGAPLPVIRGWIVGDDFENRTEDGLWPSDHLGVVIRLRP